MKKDAARYEEFLIRWLKARKETPASITIGPEPDPSNFGFRHKSDSQDEWQVKQIRDRVNREMARNA